MKKFSEDERHTTCVLLSGARSRRVGSPMQLMMTEGQGPGLTTLLRRLVDILDRWMPDEESGMCRVTTRAIEYVERNQAPEAVLTLGDALRKNPIWMRGYLLLATIYRETNAAEHAVMTLEAGTRVCRSVLQVLVAQIRRSSPWGPSDQSMQTRLFERMARTKRYDDMLRNQLARTLVEIGQLEEALVWLSEAHHDPVA